MTPKVSLQRVRRLAHAKLAKTPKLQRAGITRLERQIDVYVGSLRHGISTPWAASWKSSLGFPDGAVRIKQFEDLGRCFCHHGNGVASSRRLSRDGGI